VRQLAFLQDVYVYGWLGDGPPEAGVPLLQFPQALHAAGVHAATATTAATEGCLADAELFRFSRDHTPGGWRYSPRAACGRSP
jgi:hypothetical protein